MSLEFTSPGLTYQNSCCPINLIFKGGGGLPHAIASKVPFNGITMGKQDR